MKTLDIQGTFDIGRRGKKYVPGKTMTEQSHARGVDVNTIVSRFKKTGDTGLLARTIGEYKDLESIDLHEAMNQIRKANEIFMELPSEVRNRFENDPEKYFDFAIDPENHQEMRELGLLKPETQEIISKVEIVNGAPQGAPEGSEVTVTDTPP